MILALLSCGGPERALASLEGAWDCVDDEAEPEFLEVAPGSLRLEQIGPVGSEGDEDVPEGTVCRTEETAGLLEVTEDGGTFEWRLSYKVDRVELVDDPENTDPCETWAARQNALAVVDLRGGFSFDDPEGDVLETSERTCARRP